MKTYDKNPENVSRTLDARPQASKQAPLHVLLQSAFSSAEGTRSETGTQTPARSSSRSAALPRVTSLPPATSLLQLKMGFEFQPLNVIITHLRKEVDLENATPVSFDKFTDKKPYRNTYGEGKIHLERDGYNPELITEPFAPDESLDTVGNTIGSIPIEWETIVSDIKECAFNEYKDTYNEDRGSDKEATCPDQLIQVTGEQDPRFDVQSTVSLSLEKVPELMDKIYSQTQKTFPAEGYRSSAKDLKQGKITSQIKKDNKWMKGDAYGQPVETFPFRRRRSIDYLEYGAIGRKTQADRNMLHFLTDYQKTREHILRFIDAADARWYSPATKNKVKGFFELTFLNLKALKRATGRNDGQPGIKAGIPVLVKSHLGGLYTQLDETEKDFIDYVLSELDGIGDNEFTHEEEVKKILPWETITDFTFVPRDYYDRLKEGQDRLSYFEGFAEANTEAANSEDEKQWYAIMRSGSASELEAKAEYEERTQSLRTRWNQRLGERQDLAVVELRELGSIGLTLDKLAPWGTSSFEIYQTIEGVGQSDE